MTALETGPGPAGSRVRRVLGALYALLTSPKLAIAMLIGVLLCCLVGVTVLSAERAWQLIFTSLWFNALLVALAFSSGATFFSRIWRRKLTMISVGMIVFHMSFLTMLGGIVLNSFFHFRGTMRLTEGETLPNGTPDSYDVIEHGRYFDFSRLRGETTLVKMHRRYSLGAEDKRVAYEISVGEGDQKQQEIVYITHALDHDGVRYFNAKEGYSLLVVLADKEGKLLYGAHVPLQSLQQEDGSFVYATGSKTAASPFPFPPPSLPPVLDLLLVYRPDPKVDRAGEVMFQTWSQSEASGAEPRVAEGLAKIGEGFQAGDYALAATEVRYWVGMNVRYDPGLTTILSSLVAGLAGMILTFIGRIRQDAAKRRRKPVEVTP